MDSNLQAMLSENPDMVFEEVVTITIDKDDMDFWLKFTSEWGGVLYYLDERNSRQHEQGHIGQDQYEFIRRTYRLGLITTTGLHDKLKLSKDEAGEDEYAFSMDSLECYFIPAYLREYCSSNNVLKALGEKYIQSMLQGLESYGKPEEKLASIQQLVEEYITNMHNYAKQQ
ncbi:hypothetical protein [Paenibacillus sp. UNC451MF]|uniref:hypothetical protein n=1 Tax=Paenibacillus sp. UNC451MF TaxID=1449063 RepID=UPI00049141A6|nr:hypothetical protein [Paenibacillus sp. UNC451MF]